MSIGFRRLSAGDRLGWHMVTTEVRVRLAQKRRWVAGLAAVTFATSALVGTVSVSSASASTYPKIPSGPIKIGFVGPLSGSLAALGLGEEAADKVYVKLINSQGGVAGHKIQLLIGNDQNDPATGVSETEQLISEGAVAFVADGFGDVLASDTAVTTRSKVPVLVQEATNAYSLETTKYPYFFNNTPINQQDADAIAKYLAGKGLKKVAIVTDGTPYGADLTTSLQKAAPKYGLTITTTQTYSATAIDVTTQLKASQQSGAQALIVAAETGFVEVGSGLSQIGWSPTVIESVVSYDYPTSLPSALLANAATPCPAGLPSGKQPSAALARAMQLDIKATGDALPDVGVALELDSLYTLKYAIQLNHSTSGPAIKAALQAIRHKSFVDPTFSYTFTAKDHAGFAGVDGLCHITPRGPDGLPVLVG